MRPRVAVGSGLAAVALVALTLAWWWLPWQRLPSAPRFLSVELPEVRMWARDDQVEPIAADELGVVADQVEIWLESPRALGPVVFRVGGRPGTIRVSSGGSRQDYLPSARDSKSRFYFEWSPDAARRAKNRPGQWYRLTVSFPDLSFAPPAPGNDVHIAFVGTRALLDRDLYHVDWLGCGAPKAVAAGERFLVLAHARNTSEHPWPDQGHAGVRLAWRWPSGDAARRTRLAAVSPQGEFERWLEVHSPSVPGRYRLEIDLYFEPVAWFSERGASTCSVDVEVR